ncbi:MAG: hypothetical protein GF310_14960 [candidate division Zixibacteria bacterium]|nr:hypothetical protein [candidate division Zixibacteria bacterium]
MRNEGNQELMARSLSFFGAVTASVTHELTNVIAIINELTGLLDDMRYSAEQGQTIESDRLENLHGRLTKQINRGERIIKRLNKFAHSADNVEIEFELNEVLFNLSELMQRPADMKRIKLVFKPADMEIRCTSNPFELQHIIFRCCKMFLDSADENSAIHLEVEKKDDKRTIIVSCSDISDEKLAKGELESIRNLAEIQDWDTVTEIKESKFSFALII